MFPTVATLGEVCSCGRELCFRQLGLKPRKPYLLHVLWSVRILFEQTSYNVCICVCRSVWINEFMYACKTCLCALHKSVCGRIQMHAFLTLALYGAEWSVSLPSCFIPGILWGNNSWPRQEYSAFWPRSLLAYRLRCPDLHVCMWIFVCMFGSCICVLFCASLHGLWIIFKETWTVYHNYSLC